LKDSPPKEGGLQSQGFLSLVSEEARKMDAVRWALKMYLLPRQNREDQFLSLLLHIEEVALFFPTMA
jgi:hypothetical protein